MGDYTQDYLETLLNTNDIRRLWEVASALLDDYQTTSSLLNWIDRISSWVDDDEVQDRKRRAYRTLCAIRGALDDGDEEDDEQGVKT